MWYGRVYEGLVGKVDGCLCVCVNVDGFFFKFRIPQEIKWNFNGVEDGDFMVFKT